MYFKQLLFVGFGGFIGSALRFMISGWSQRVLLYGAFPIGTLVVNVAGCLCIGFLGGLIEFRQVLDPGQRLFLMVGVLGGFTTFSTFAFETLALAQDTQLVKAAANVLLQIILGFGAALLGYVGARLL